MLIEKSDLTNNVNKYSTQEVNWQFIRNVHKLKANYYTKVLERIAKLMHHGIK